MPMRTSLASQLRVTTQTVLLSQLLRLPDAAVDEAIDREVADNPALERRPAAQRFRPPRAAPDTDPFDGVPSRESPLDLLFSQARLLVPVEDLAVVGYLLDCLDEHGFLRATEDDLARETKLSPARVARAIAWLQRLDPPGIGARDLRECFQLQCLDLESRSVDCRAPRRILDAAWNAFTRQEWRRVARLSGLSLPDVEAAVAFMRERLYPYPLLLAPGDRDSPPPLAQPDLIVRRLDGDGLSGLVVDAPAPYLAELRISAVYQRAIRAAAPTGGATDPAAWAWLQQAVGRARLFIDALERRRSTLERIGAYLVEQQADFFADGPRSLKPLTRTDAARALGLHESTVSRAVSDKVLQLPNGRLVALSDLFDGSLAAKACLREIVAASDEPLSDRELADQMRLRSFDLSRRTVTQYREEMGIPRMGLRGRGKTLEARSP